MSTEPFVFCDNLVKIYKVADLEVVALQGLDLDVRPGEVLALVGPSGAGKSTLLNVIGGLDTPSAGAVRVAGWNLLKMGQQDRVRYKRAIVGFVWQQPARNLISYLSARENVEMPMSLAGVPAGKRRSRALELLDIVGLAERADHRPDRLSGGEQQRAALAVALANNPPLLLGDELTGQIDSQSAAEVFAALRRINRAYGTTIIVVTHDPFIAGIVDRVIAIRDGRTSTEIRRRLDADNGVLHEEEWVILDQAGRLQLPQPFVEHLGLEGRAKVRLEEDHVSVWPGFSELSRNVPKVLKKSKTHLSSWEDDAETSFSGVEIVLEGLSRTFILGKEEIHAVHDVSATIPSGELCVFKGRSGSGKTTLLNLIAGLDAPTSGSVRIDGRDVAAMSPSELIRLRREQIGFVYQTFGLLPFLSAEENVAVPLRLLRLSRRARRERTQQMLDLVGLADRARHRVYELSGGEQQRVAIARALVKYPSLLLADEPTGQLDSATGAAIVVLLKEVVAQTGITVVLATHDAKVMEAADRVFELKDGRLVGEHVSVGQ